MKKFILIFFALAILSPISANAQSTAANKAWPTFWTQFRSAVVRKDKSAILAFAIDDSRFERDAGGDSPNDFLDFWLSSRMYKKRLLQSTQALSPGGAGRSLAKAVTGSSLSVAGGIGPESPAIRNETT